MSIRVKVTWNGKKTIKKFENQRKKVLSDAAEALLEESKQEVPHDEGTLENSGSTSVGKDEANVYYDTPYAIRLHEHPEYKFKGKGKGKWHERALRRISPKLIKYIKGRLKL